MSVLLSLRTSVFVNVMLFIEIWRRTRFSSKGSAEASDVYKRQVSACRSEMQPCALALGYGAGCHSSYVA